MTSVYRSLSQGSIDDAARMVNIEANAKIKKLRASRMVSLIAVAFNWRVHNSLSLISLRFARGAGAAREAIYMTIGCKPTIA